jgi:hypothetical protein
VEEGISLFWWVFKDVGDFFDGGCQAAVGGGFRHFAFSAGELYGGGDAVPSGGSDKNEVMAVVVHGRADIVAFTAMITEGLALVGALVNYDFRPKGCKWCFIVVEQSKELGVGGEFSVDS